MSPPGNVIRLPRVGSLSPDDCRLLVESVIDYAIFMLDPNGCVATWNPGAQRLKGYAADEIVGQHFSKFYPPEDVAANKPQIELETARQFGRVEDEGWRVRKDGTRFWASVVITALRDDTGHLRGFGKVTRDLTEKKRVEERLRESEERFRLLVESVGDYAIYMLDPSGIVSTWNLGAERMKGYRADEIVGKSFSLFFPEEDRKAGKPERELATALAEGRFEEEAWRVRKDGGRFWANVVVTAIRDGSGEILGFAKVTRDLTARRKAEETQRALTREQTARAIAEGIAARAEEASRIKDEFLATVSHELRTPLNAIVGWASMLRRRALDASVGKAVEVIHRNAEAQARIVEDILDVSRVITGKLRIDPRPTDLVAVASEALEVVRPSADAKQISLELDTEAPCVLVGDGERLRQVAWNLLSNAVKFTDRGGSIHLAIRREGPCVVLEVSDTGQGIEPDFLPYVFDRFRQADSSITRRVGGLGLGLALVRHIVELHGGSVAVASDGPGRGATFTVKLPVRAMPRTEQPPSSSAAHPAPAPCTAPALDGVRVLVVDDDLDACDLLASVLEDAGAAVETARSAAEGFAAFERFRADVIISDIGMPVEDGYSFIGRVRAVAQAAGRNVPSLALTAYTRSEDRAKALAAGFTTHIGKPVNPDDLLSVVAELATLAPR